MNDPLWNFVRRIEFRKYVALKSWLSLSKAAQIASREMDEEQLTPSHSCLCSPCNIQAYCSKVPPGFWRLFGSTPSFCLSLAASTCHDGYCQNGGTCSVIQGKANCRYALFERSSCLAKDNAFLISLDCVRHVNSCLHGFRAELTERCLFSKTEIHVS